MGTEPEIDGFTITGYCLAVYAAKTFSYSADTPCILARLYTKPAPKDLTNNVQHKTIIILLTFCQLANMQTIH